MTKKYFITGTDTNVGKTVTSAILTYALKAQYWKPIQSGIEDDLPHNETVQHLTTLSSAHFYPSEYSLKASLSPDQAAELENIEIDLKNCHLPITNNYLIVEGAGGIFVPLNKENTLLDLMKKLALPIVIVARGTLGTINHTLMTIEILRQKGLSIHGVIFNGELNPDNSKAIEYWGKVKTLLHIPYFNNLTPEELQAWVCSEKSNILENFA